MQPQRYPLVPWGDISRSDLEPQGTPDLSRRRADLPHWVLLDVRGTAGIALGTLVLRCAPEAEGRGPLTIRIDARR